ncbi:MAG: methionine synthase [Candidatus Binatus sp.]|uniref:methionine synthase n=1 Tax=Candidatus Binatus sp. TaxID=2811406 RepID=UPI00271F9253|nr:methionine synthase [Candidatus Binatus sp.]MDO8432544.1 methionine synthase [Candidatus Binatus sp.]
MTTNLHRIKHLKELLAERILVLDGAFGTFVLGENLSAEDYGGVKLEGCNENVVRTRPDLIRRMHAGFLEVGADIIETASFGSTPIVLAEYGLQADAHELNRIAAMLAREEAERFSTPEKPRFVAGSMGPTTKSISITGGVTFEQMCDAYRIQAEGLIEGGVDVLLVETVNDTLNCKAALVGIEKAIAKTGSAVGVAVSGTIETMGTLLAGQDIDAFYSSLAHRDLLWMGLNCATGPDFMTDHLRTLSEISRFYVACVPNAGLPDEEGHYNETPEMLARKIGRFAENGWVNLVGGCCGTTSEHIRLLVQAVEGRRPRERSTLRRSVVSGIETLVIDADTRPVIVGERTNVLGSRKFKRLIADGKFEEASEVGRVQVRRGAHILDVCLQDPDRDEMADVTRFLEIEVKKVKVPLMIDSTDHLVIEESLKRTQGKSLINSINLEDGEERFQKVVPLARRYGAALVVGCIDDDKQQAQAVTRARKLEVALRSHKLLTEKYGVEPEDIVFDPLVFPVGTGDKNYIGSGVETIEGIRLIKQALPQCKTILGISNVSFGLPEAGREVLNAVMLYHCVQAGLDLAIVNSEKLQRYPSIPEEERRLAEDLIWWRGDDAIAAFAAYFRARKSAVSAEDRKSMPLDGRLGRYILEGSRDGLYEDLDEALTTRGALEIINGPLMAGMDEVGRLFNANQMIVAEVLQSAEAMKAAVAYLEPHMKTSESANKGKIILATVKGDVHDIGKNLVEIILGNNGYKIVNLGIKVPPEELIRAFREHQPDAIGLSGLLVKSAQMMVITAQDLKTAGIDCPILVGGAALSNRFTRLKIAPEYDGLVAYANDAMSGLDLANQIMDYERRESLKHVLAEQSRKIVESAPKVVDASPEAASRRATVRRDIEIPKPPDLKIHVLRDYDLGEILRYVNPAMLYSRHLGLKNAEQALASGDPKALELRAVVESVTETMLGRKDITANAIYKFFPAQSDGDRSVMIYSADGNTVLESFTFGRQSDAPHLCLADYVAPRGSGQTDYLCMYITTVGAGVRALAEQWKNDGEYLRSHVLQVLALEGAEAFAELLHMKIRQMWGFSDPPGLTKKDLFRGHYHGKRFSFGYPACPRLEDQEQLFRLLEVDKNGLGVKLTEGFMMDPESAVSAVVFHHPEAKYFSLSPSDIERLEREFDDPSRKLAAS